MKLSRMRIKFEYRGCFPLYSEWKHATTTMDLKKLFTEERAVSPVIGVILMVAITVILAAVIGAFVLGIGGETDAAPQASLSLSEENGENNFSIEHRGGDRIDFNDITIIVSADGETDRLSLTEGDSPGDSEYLAVPDQISTGDTANVEISDIGAADDQNVRIRLLHVPSDSIILDRSVDIDFG